MIPHAIGLSSDEAARRLAAQGPNELGQSERRTAIRIAFEVLSEPMFLMLFAAGVAYLLLGDLGEALLVVALATASIGITIVQESRSERTLDALRDLTSPRALVLRDGERKRVPGREVVEGDVVVLTEGDRVPADSRLVSAVNLQCDESLLTGESVPVRKTVAEGAAVAGTPGGDNLPFVFSGTLVVTGQGMATVVATGARSEIGMVGKAVSSIAREAPPLQRQTARLVRIFGVGGAALSIIVALLYGWLRGGWLDAALAGIALNMALLPEEFPLVLTVYVVMGAWRISRAGVLTRRSSAIETLGSATVLCTDKTGTLTENRMSIAEVRPATSILRWGEAGAPERLVHLAMLASEPEPYDPMERAFHHSAAQAAATAPAITALARRYPITPEFPAMTNVWAQPEGTFLVAAKGAPEAIADLCRLDPEQRRILMGEADEMAARGMRVLAVAEAAHGGPHPETQDRFHFALLGLIGLADPLRAGVPEAVAECRDAGIRVLMITGDYPATALAIAALGGIRTDGLLTGPEIAAMSEGELAAAVRAVTVFARVQPAQKLRIVEALKRNGEVVAMTGDGVNDAPSLKAAHIGVSMGGRGTDVAREASAIVLLHDDFGSLVKTIRLGRRIYDNIRKAMGFVMAAHVPIAGMALFPLLFGLPLILMPVHIAFLEMIVDPVCSVAFEAEPEERDIMRRPPRAPAAPLFSASLVGWSLFQGLTVLGAAGTVVLLASWGGLPETEIRALAFVAIVIGNVVLILVNRSFSTSLWHALSGGNPTLWGVLAVDGALLGVILAWPVTRELFRFGPIHADDIAFAISGALAALVLLEGAKRVFADELRGSRRSRPKASAAT